MRVPVFAMLAALSAWAAGNALAEPLECRVGDAARGRAIVADRSVGMCLLCHRAPIAEERFQGTIGPDLAGVGARLSREELRARLVDPARFNPQTVMPAYRRSAGLQRVAQPWRARSIFDAQQVEDVVAWLATLQ